jgi:hypothetical protein
LLQKDSLCNYVFLELQEVLFLATPIFFAMFSESFAYKQDTPSKPALSAGK